MGVSLDAFILDRDVAKITSGLGQNQNYSEWGQLIRGAIINIW